MNNTANTAITFHATGFSVDVQRLAQEGAVAAYHVHGMTDEVWYELLDVFEGDREAIRAQLGDM